MIPLSTRMRPQGLDEFKGQEHFLYPGSLFYNSIKNRTFDSAIFWGLPARKDNAGKDNCPGNGRRVQRDKRICYRNERI